MKEVFTIVKIILSYAGFYIGYVLGPMSGLLIALCIFMLFDYITGVISAIISKTLSSDVGFKGLARKVFILVLVGVGHLIDVYVLGTSGGVRTMVICWYLANEGVSILENAAEIGLPVPDKLRAILAQIKGDNDNADT